MLFIFSLRPHDTKALLGFKFGEVAEWAASLSESAIFDVIANSVILLGSSVLSRVDEEQICAIELVGVRGSNGVYGRLLFPIRVSMTGFALFQININKITNVTLGT